MFRSENAHNQEGEQGKKEPRHSLLLQTWQTPRFWGVVGALGLPVLHTSRLSPTRIFNNRGKTNMRLKHQREAYFCRLFGRARGSQAPSSSPPSPPSLSLIKLDQTASMTTVALSGSIKGMKNTRPLRIIRKPTSSTPMF
jgi:hypothetical protein